MAEKQSNILSAFFRFIQNKRWFVIAFYAILIGPAVYFATRVNQDNAPERLVVQSDPDVAKTRDFEAVFGKQEPVVLFLDSSDPLNQAAIRQTEQLETKLQQISGIVSQSIVSIFKAHLVAQGRSYADKDAEIAELKAFVLATDLFMRQGLVVPGQFAMIRVQLPAVSSTQRSQLLATIDKTIAEWQKNATAISQVRKVGQPYVNDYLDQDTRRSGIKSFGLFGIFVLILSWILYRSWRTLLALMIPLLVSTALTVGFVGVIGGTFTIVSSLIPMTILITCMATLVYIQSRFVQRPPDRTTDEHQVFSLVNKFLACTASIFATAVGFAALAVSKIRPIRDMGIWVAVGLAFTWLVVFTLFPALQKILKTPTQQEQAISGRWFDKLVEKLPKFSYRFRFLLVAFALLWCAGGVVALFGIPKVLPKMSLQTQALEYINHSSKLYKDTKQIEQGSEGGLFAMELWLASKKSGVALEQPVVTAVQDLARALEQPYQNHKARVADWSAFLRTTHYLLFKQDQLPKDQDAWDRFTDLIENQPRVKAAAAEFSNATHDDFSQIRLSLYTKTLDYDEFVNMQQWVQRRFAEMQQKHPQLKDFQMNVVGSGPLQAKISHHLVPTLTESFGLTVIIIFVTFLLVFRNGAARIMAMVPSLFAILAMFAFMRIFGLSLNIATILIASTVLGTSENDQIHFFYHYQEKKKTNATTEQSLRHTLLVAGRAIFFATLINAGGFLAFALADLPPIRQFGVLSSLAFVLSMLADFTALPAALWMVFRDKPDPISSSQ